MLTGTCCEPYGETNPGERTQLQHEKYIQEDAEARNKWHQRNLNDETQTSDGKSDSFI